MKRLTRAKSYSQYLYQPSSIDPIPLSILIQDSDLFYIAQRQHDLHDEITIEQKGKLIKLWSTWKEQKLVSTSIP